MISFMWILCGMYAASVVYFTSDIRKYKRVTIGQGITFGLALICGWLSAGLATFVLFILMIGWLEENSDNVLYHFKEKPKEKPLVDGEFFEVKDGQLININKIKL